MKTASLLNKTLMIGALTAAVAALSVSAQAEEKKQEMEKCYGVAKAGKNDCKAGAGTSCAGSATKDGEGFIAVPKGLCDKLVGGSTTAPGAK